MLPSRPTISSPAQVGGNCIRLQQWSRPGVGWAILFLMSHSVFLEDVHRSGVIRNHQEVSRWGARVTCHPSRFWKSQPAVLELGGGAGLVAAALASLGARIVYTDGDEAAIRTAELNCTNARAGQRRKRRRERKRERCEEHWGSCTFRRLLFGDVDGARKIVEDLGPFGHVVGSDLLYGDKAPPGPLLDTLGAVAEAQDEPFLVTLAIKNRCCDEVEIFLNEARRRGVWTVQCADTSALPESGLKASGLIESFRV